MNGPLPWHALDAVAVLARVGATPAGLDDAEAAARRERHGPNALPEPQPASVVVIVLRQFRSPLIYILLLAAALAAGSGDLGDAAFILAALGINAAIGAWQESRAERSSRALQRLLRIRATVLRNGRSVELPAEELVPGDIVALESGARVPADARLLAAEGLQLDESLLTGESLAVAKAATGPLPAATPLAERHCMVHAGSIVVRGRGQAVVTGTGTATMVGQLAVTVGAMPPGEPPLLRRMRVLGRRIGIAVLVAAVVIGALGVLVRGYAPLDMLVFAIALAVSAIPEGLPVALTVALAVCTRRMARRGVIVRRLAAVEGLGSCTLIASDKTGTLTCNELTVREAWLPDGSVYEADGAGFAPVGSVRERGGGDIGRAGGALAELAHALVLCNEGDLDEHADGWRWRGDPTDVALLSFAARLGWRAAELHPAWPRTGAIAFEPEQRFAASFHVRDGGTWVWVKGAPERVASMCADDGAVPRALRAADEMAARGLRVLFVARGPAGALPGEGRAVEPAGLQLLGIVGMIDPPRPGVREAIRTAADAGVGTIMVTGDHPVTALAIARDLGLARDADEVCSGDALAAVTPAGLAALMTRVRVFARVAPEQKLDVVRAAQAAGHVVAVTGDGVNDAPALRAADIGVAMGRGGTDVAREAAELVITDDHYASITAGIEEGRIAYDNIRRIVFLLVSTGAAEVVLVGFAVLTGMPLPLTAVQLLWLNLVTNGIQDMSLAFEPAEPDVLRRRPRPAAEPVFDRLMIERIVVSALVMGSVGFAVFTALLVAGYDEAGARNLLLLLMVLFENLHLLNCRSETRPVFTLSLLRSPVLVAGAAAALAVHVLALYFPPARAVLDTAPVGGEDWLALFVLATSVVLAAELHKLWWRRRHGTS